MSSPSVLIIRLDGIGDALALTPLLAALRERSIPCDVVLQESNAGIFSPSAVRRTIRSTFELRSGARGNLQRIASLGRELAEERYTHVLVATEDPGGYRLACAIGAAERIGFANGWRKPLKTLWVHRLLTRTVFRPAGLDRRALHECEVLFCLGRTLLDGAVPSRDAALLRPLVLEGQARAGGRIAVQITEKWLRLGIATDRIAELLGRLHRLGPVHPIASSREAAYAGLVERAAEIEVERFDALEPWKRAIAAAPALVAPDSGASHVAGMIGTPVVAVFPPTRRSALQVARWAPWASPHRIVCASAGWPAQAAEAVAALLGS
jgi:ADP-heptose:LPS heptosyltransferase